MNKKNLFKILLDLGMVIVLVLMYKKSVISMSFHEVGGLVLLGVFVIHVLINWKWVVAITKKLFHKSIPVKTKIGYILNILLLISFSLIGISGIFISKVVFQISNEGSMNWKTIHYTASAAALIFIGIHLGLHQQFISGMLKKIFHIPQKAGKIIGLTVTVIMVAFGCFSMISTDFSNWLLMPLGVQQMNGGAEKGEFGPGQRPDFEGERPDRKSGEDETQDASDAEESTEVENFPEGRGIPDGRQQAGGIGNVIVTIGQYFSIIYVFATITVVANLLIMKGKQKNKG
jgi:hypothetical protein